MRGKFAVRGGGHIPVPEAAAIKDGVLISTELLNLKELSKDKKLAKLGPGNRWGDVYAWISPNNLYVAGGRYGPVGVPGLLLGGGISYFGSKRGCAAGIRRSVQKLFASISLKAAADAVYLTNKTFTDTTVSIPELKNVLGLAVASTQ
ncbi:MAG: hypothetical protein Q9216_001913 [Gyalolechia sp. 2 TL-2023]